MKSNSSIVPFDEFLASWSQKTYLILIISSESILAGAARHECSQESSIRFSAIGRSSLAEMNVPMGPKSDRDLVLSSVGPKSWGQIESPLRPSFKKRNLNNSLLQDVEYKKVDPSNRDPQSAGDGNIPGGLDRQTLPAGIEPIQD